MQATNPYDYHRIDFMHVVSKASLGLGKEENGVLGCRYHHSLMDNGNKGLRDEMIGMLEEYLSGIYDGWSRELVTYNKYKFLEEMK